MTKTPFIHLKNLHKSFGSKVVLKGLNLDVKEGESFVILGGSGTGKSVTLKCILGLLTPDKGTMTVDGVNLLTGEPSEISQIRDQISMLFQGSALFDSLPVWENVVFKLLAQDKIRRSEGRSFAKDLILQVGMEERVLDLSPNELSGGMLRRVALARAIATKPRIVFFDEPTAGLDPITGSIINGLIRKSVDHLGATAITITHDIASCRQIGDRVGLLHEGKLRWVGPIKDMDKSGDAAVEQFIKGRSKGPLTATA